ncbi:Armadillo-type fold protein [Cordyceps fumosorosea ARSEF 2679]|uniref:MMS19 nucleotide excision repair protein n=1 Tax=Cordyceps fumosorosea (strain ARSEF 2679) TaxID=1081104 RepID=A0A162JN41_CORFA|nr:Armadillo-type fold protein [Cordyceps fumosorosea ARSEF 2679]OAA71322.1 Armadillo-type fold protein [Cordyceps fumosorosea ARSEF 2679]
MADFRQLALEFVLADDEAKQSSFAKQAAQGKTPNRRSRHKPRRPLALEFLSQTLEYVAYDVLKASQVKLLVGFFGAMFDVDHKAGVLPSASALSKIVAMKSFQPSTGLEIIQKVCALKEDFSRQIANTRLAVYELLRSLISHNDVASNIKRRDDSAGFIVELIDLCRSERDPDCLLVWFDILYIYMLQYSPEKDVLERVYGSFKAYFPITLPRTAQSKVTPEELKSQLRKCFSAHHALAEHTIPFLVGKLDQGDGVTVNVKVDVLRTLKACLEQYEDPKQSVVPFANRIWGSLKYEVRNGEIEDTIWATLEALKALTTRLSGDDLRDFTLNVTRDCVSDLSNAMYAGAAGRLLVAILSASPGAFVLMVAPAITHIKENLRHPKSESHSCDLLRLLRVILETRILLMKHTISSEELSDFVSIDSVFKTLYSGVFRTPLMAAKNANASQEDLKVGAETVQGAAVLLCQRASVAVGGTAESPRLLSDDDCAEICDSLFEISVRHSQDPRQHPSASDELVNETVKSLQRIVLDLPSAFTSLLQKGTTIIHDAWTAQGMDAAKTIQDLGSMLAYVGCSELPSSASPGLTHFVTLICALTNELLASVAAKADNKLWCSLVAGIQSACRYFNDACFKQDLDRNQLRVSTTWLSDITNLHPELKSVGYPDASHEVDMLKSSTVKAMADVYGEFLLITLFIVRTLYRKAAHTTGNVGNESIVLSDDFPRGDQFSASQYLYLISSLASFVTHKFTETQQAALAAETWAINLFQDGYATTPSSWKWLVNGRVNSLTFGIVEALHPPRVAKLFDGDIGQQMLVAIISSTERDNSATATAVSKSILSILANKYTLETAEPVLDAINTQLANALLNSEESSINKAIPILAIAAGLLRRYNGKQTQRLVELIRDSPKNKVIGYQIARRLELIAAPQSFLSKDAYAVVKPLWLQKLYMQMAQPMLQCALSTGQSPYDNLAKTSFGLGVLMLVKHMPYSIYEDDVEQLLRVAISVAQTVGLGTDTLASLDVLKTALTEAPEKSQDHVRSIIGICTSTFAVDAAPKPKPEWVPEAVAAPSRDPETLARCGKAGLQILGGLPRLLDSRHLLAYVPQVERHLAAACGHRSRDVRASARAARVAWGEVK